MKIYDFPTVSSIFRHFWRFKMSRLGCWPHPSIRDIACSPLKNQRNHHEQRFPYIRLSVRPLILWHRKSSTSHVSSSSYLAEHTCWSSAYINRAFIRDISELWTGYWLLGLVNDKRLLKMLHLTVYTAHQLHQDWQTSFIWKWKDVVQTFLIICCLWAIITANSHHFFDCNTWTEVQSFVFLFGTTCSDLFLEIVPRR